METMTAVKKFNSYLSSKVGKSLAPEEKSIVENVAALLGQLLNSSNADEVQMAEKAENDVLKEDNGPTAEDKAEVRVETNTELTEDNYAEVGKALGDSIMNKVNKSLAQSNDNTAIMAALTDITQVLKSLTKQTAENDKAINGIIEGLGVSEAMITDNSVAKSERNVPVGTLDNGAILTELTSVLKSLNAQNKVAIDSNRPLAWDQAHNDREVLKEAGKYLLGR